MAVLRDFEPIYQQVCHAGSDIRVHFWRLTPFARRGDARAKPGRVHKDIAP